uniref:Transmembrane protein n=1 Tax=Polynucleobacter necessarius subsp. necessarius (strain STIR1) TaxID=452638 RepID=B1XVT7_POLNS
MLKNFAIYLSFLVALVAIDLVWLLGIAKNLYRDQMGDLMASEPKLIAGLAFYLLYALGVCIFVIVPALSKQSLIYALQYGALFGLFCYMTYDLTNLAVIRNFPIQLALIDIAWGSFVTALCAGLTYWVGNHIS